MQILIGAYVRIAHTYEYEVSIRIRIAIIVQMQILSLFLKSNIQNLTDTPGLATMYNHIEETQLKSVMGFKHYI